MAKILVGPVRFSELCPEAGALLRADGHELVENLGTVPFTKADIRSLARDVEAAIVGMDVWDADAIASAPRLKILSKLGVGIDNIDGVAARAQGVDVTNVPGGNANAVAEMAIGLMLAAARHIVPQDRTIRAGGWDRLTGVELTGKNVGLLGFGHTAQQVARRLAGFDTHIVASDPYADLDVAADLGVRIAELEEVISLSDFISVHIPHGPQTHHMISDAQFAHARPGSVFVNTSRGGVVDEDALVRALQAGAPGSAGVDVWETEPVPPTHPLLTLDNVVATCHGAADTYEAYAQVGLITARAINDRLAGGRPRNIQNK
jgi:D-3-phosphoglycerate dehydrogenase